MSIRKARLKHFTVYIDGLFFFEPVLNDSVNDLNRKRQTVAYVVLIIVIRGLPTGVTFQPSLLAQLPPKAAS